MITIRDDFGQILACCEFWLVNPDGSRNPDGQYAWIHQLEVSKSEDGKDMIRQIIKEIASAYPNIIGAYWQRVKTHDAPHLFSRRVLVKEAM